MFQLFANILHVLHLTKTEQQFIDAANEPENHGKLWKILIIINLIIVAVLYRIAWANDYPITLVIFVLIAASPLISLIKAADTANKKQ